MKRKDYYVGLDIGTNSIGYAVTDPEYNLIKFKGEPMWGTHVFNEGATCKERRLYRTGRRRLNRRQQRIKLVQELFAKEIAKVDERFFIRLQESSLYRDDTSGEDSFVVFNDITYTDQDYYEEYPTIHHVICELIKNKETHDVRLVYLAIAWLVAHRGHFLSEVDKDNIESIRDFHVVYNSFLEYFGQNDMDIPWRCEENEFQKILLQKTTVREKESAFYDLLFGGKKPKNSENSVYGCEAMLKLLSGGTTNNKKLFPQIDFEDKISISLKKSEEEFENILINFGDEAELLRRLKNIYDWAILYESLENCTYISEAKVKIYEQHKKDLAMLKKFVRKYLPKKYNEIFRDISKNNYTAYSANVKSLDSSITIKNEKKVTQEEFCDYLKKMMKSVICDEDDKVFFNDMMFRLEQGTFMPKQVQGNNRVLPYQIYYVELKAILENAKEYIPCLSDIDADGYVTYDKLLSIMEFCIPYYVGPLHRQNSPYAWIERKKQGRILPWNFNEMVDLDASEAAFINRMTNSCTYIPGESVLPKNSLLYCKFMVLNEINNLKVNGIPITPDAKQGVYEQFLQYRKMTLKKIEAYLISEGFMKVSDILSGVDSTVKANLHPYHDFKSLMKQGMLNENQVEDIIARITYSEDKARIRKWIDSKYGFLSEKDRKYVSKLKYKGFGRLSKKFLKRFRAINKETGELWTIIETMWETNDNMMQIIFSENYTFKEKLQEIKEEYYHDHAYNVEQLMEEMHLSNAVKRPVYRTLDIVKDIKKACGADPTKIFVEMARGSDREKKRTKTRRDQIKELYSNMDKQEVQELSQLLESKTDNQLQSDVLFLYFIQLGRCMYSGEVINLEQLKNSEYVNIDHIYPQSYVKDDSLNNKVLTLSSYNGKKSNAYPVRSDWQNNMKPMWIHLKNCHLMSEEKFKRLTRTTPFSEEEKMGFINRQLVETRQSTKAVTVILQQLFPNTEIVYVKAGLVTDFRHEFEIVKTRLVNDLHHAKDAYLNIVCGNVYNMKFTKRWFSVDQEYTLKTKQLYTNKVMSGKNCVWKGKQDLVRVKEILSKNNIHYTRYAFIRKGGFFDQMPLGKSEKLIPRKAELEPERYGGYNKSTAACFLLVKYVQNGKKPKSDIMIMPVELLYVNQLFSDEAFALQYAQKTIATIEKKAIESIIEIEFPFGLRPLKINTMLALDGYKACITGKVSEGKEIGCVSMIPLVLDREKEKYIKALESFSNKKLKNANITIDSRYSIISQEKNMELYMFFSEKLKERPFVIAYASITNYLENGKAKFESLALEEQVESLLNILEIFKTSRSSGCNLTSIGGGKTVGKYSYSTKISNILKHVGEIKIIDTSASGLFSICSENIGDLL